ncbi:MAG: metalloregulator ArsR/SmtB family transcription factor [Myxococcota bacterium]
MDSTLQALADPRRRAIVELLQQRERPVRELVEALPIAQSGVSRHLRILREAGLVRSRAQGQQRIYELRPEPFDELAGWLQRVRERWNERLDNLERELKRRQQASNSREDDK